MAFASFTTLVEAFRNTVRNRPDAIALRTVEDDISLTWRQLADRAGAIGSGLAALGLRRRDCLGLMLTNRPEFNVCDLAAVLVGATPFSIYNTSAPEQIEFVLLDSSAQILVTEQALLPAVLLARKNVPDLHTIVVVDGEAPEGGITLAELEERGRTEPIDLEQAARAAAADEVLTLIYTSGTTGAPKGVELTHTNVHAAAEAAEGRVPFPEGARVISWLPAAHIAERLAHHYLPIVHGATITTCPDPRRIGEYLPQVEPSWFFAVPRVWEKMKAALEPALAAMPGGTEALAQALEKVRLEQRGEQVGPELRASVAEADARYFAPLRAKLGFGSLACANVGAAPIPPEVLYFFHAVGVPVSELWGMSETTGAGCSNPLDRIRVGTIGIAAPGVEIRLADDGEILLRGDCVMKGYRNQPELTAQTVADGWLHTGDLGTMDADGYVSIVDRKKELLINAMGKNISPALVESRIKSASPLVGHACAIGDGRAYVTALIVLDADAAPAWAAAQGITATRLADLARNEQVQAAVQQAIDVANASLARVEQVKKFTIVKGDWLPSGDELTPTMKLKRRPIAEKYADAIAAMY